MTFEEAVSIGKSKLVEHEARLKAKVKGTRPYSQPTVRLIQQHFQDRVLPTPEAMMQMIDSVLDRLEAEGHFWMSEPAHDDGRWVTTLKHNDLRLTLSCGYDSNNDLQQWKVQCWYYPAN